jgi:hypothetical protein
VGGPGGGGAYAPPPLGSAGWWKSDTPSPVVSTFHRSLCARYVKMGFANKPGQTGVKGAFAPFGLSFSCDRDADRACAAKTACGLGALASQPGP